MNEINTSATECASRCKIENFPQLLPLVDGDESTCSFFWDGRHFEISSIIYRDPKTAEKIVVFGLWDTSKEQKRISVGLLNASLFDKNAVVSDRNFDSIIPKEELPEKFMQLDSMAPSRYRQIEEGMYIHASYRKSGLSDVFYAQALVVLESMGIRTVTFHNDLTARKADQEDMFYGSATLRYKSTTTGLFLPQSPTSFYTKYKVGKTQSVLKKGDAIPTQITQVSTSISPMQESLLKEAFSYS